MRDTPDGKGGQNELKLNAHVKEWRSQQAQCQGRPPYSLLLQLLKQAEAGIRGGSVMSAPRAVHDAAIGDNQVDVVTAGSHAGGVEGPWIAGGGCRRRASTAGNDRSCKGQGSE